jgi:hypothetical protein
MEDTFPDIGSMSDQELKDLIATLAEEERELSYRRRLLHGKIDILRAELVVRLQAHVEKGESPLSEVDLDKLTEILAVKAAPRISDDELEALSRDQG